MDNTTTTVVAQGQRGQGAEFIDGISPWMPDFMADKFSDMAGIVFAICIIVAFVGLLTVLAGIGFKRQDGRSDQNAEKLLWVGGAAMGLGVAVPAFQWIFSG